jgi:hypothetical protein
MHFRAMKFFPWPAAFVGSLALALAACSGPSTMSRINSNRALYDTWPLEIKDAVLAQKAIPGINRDMVRVALGKPTQVIPGANPGEEVWVYNRGGSGGGGGPNIQLGTNIGGIQVGGGNGGGGGMGPGPGDEDSGEVMFKDGLVVRSNVIP